MENQELQIGDIVHIDNDNGARFPNHPDIAKYIGCEKQDPVYYGCGRPLTNLYIVHGFFKFYNCKKVLICTNLEKTLYYAFGCETETKMKSYVKVSSPLRRDNITIMKII